MDVLYTCDNNYVWLLGISVISMFENNKDLDNLHVWLLGENISVDNKRILKDIGDKYSREITVIDVMQQDVPQALVSTRWPYSAFTRLYSGELLPDYIKKVLYLDCDTIVRGRISELDKWDVSGKVFWGVKDCIGKNYKINIGLEPDAIYTNAGVLLINLDELRTVDIYNKLSAYTAQYDKFIYYADQDILNGAFKGDIGILPPEFNVMTVAAAHSYKVFQQLRHPTNYYTEREINNAVTNPVIIHYTVNMLMVRPWFLNTDHPFAEEFRNYMAMSPWKERQLAVMHFNSKEAWMIRMVCRLPQNISNSILGFLHSVIIPLSIRLKAMRW